MKEYIEREAACAYKPPVKKERRYSTYNLDDAFENGYDEHIKQVEAIPAADVVEVRHGWWLTKEYMYGDPDVGIEDMWIDRPAEQSDYYAYCSICGKDAEYNAEGSLILSDYCPNCGAKMDGGVNDAAD